MENNEIENKTEEEVTTAYLVKISLLAAVVVLMAFTPLGYLRVGALSITFLVVPVTVGSIVLGPFGGMILGAIFGITSFVQCFGLDPFGTTLFSINPIFTFIVCIPTRMLMGLLAGLVFKAMAASNKKGVRIASVFVTSVLGPLFNTIFFMTAFCLCFYNTEYVQGFVTTLGAANPLVFVMLFVGVNGAVEIVVNFIVCTAASKAILAAESRSAANGYAKAKVRKPRKERKDKDSKSK